MENEPVFRELPAGTTLANGKYVIEKVLGIGGFGITYKARHATLNQYFAIKEFFINGYCVRNTMNLTVHLQGMQKNMYDKYRQKFVEEAQTLAKLDHPHIVKVTDVFDENQTAYLIMPFVQGVTLQSMVEKEGVLSYEMGVNYMAQVCEALVYIHKHDILHRDIKPDNIMVTADNKVVLIDFGSAREFVHDQVQSHTSILTQGYAPPEQYATNSRKGAYSDVYSIGATFYFLVTGKRPVDAAARLLQTLDEPKKLCPNLPESANRTIMKAMDIKPENRYQTIDELMCDLTGSQDWNSTSDIKVIVKGGGVKKWIIWLVLGLVLLLAGGGAWYYQQNKEKQIVEAQMRDLMNGKVENMKVWVYENGVYLAPTIGTLDKNVFYTISNDGEMKTVDRLPEYPACSHAYLYSGQMKDGAPNDGIAIYDKINYETFDNNKPTYTGQFDKGLRHGSGGVFIYYDGTKYEGVYENDQKNNNGTETYTDGSYYKGGWKNDKQNGYGEFVDDHGNKTKGIFEAGKLIERQ